VPDDANHIKDATPYHDVLQEKPASLQNSDEVVVRALTVIAVGGKNVPVVNVGRQNGTPPLQVRCRLSIA